MRLLVIGKSGQVVSAILEAGPARDVDVVTAGRPDFDLAAPQLGLQRLRDMRPDVIVSAAAYTAVDKAESDVEAAERVNAKGPAVLARFAEDAGIPIVHLSTDYVFDGNKTGPYVESDPTNPLSVYGATKLQGELAVSSGAADHVILRTAWVYSSFGSNFVKTMLRLAETKDELRVVDDQRGNPTSAHDLANAIISVAGNLLAYPGADELRGTFHVAGSSSASWADFAAEIFACSAAMGGPHATVVRVSTTDYPTAAKRPSNSQLDTTKLRTFHGIHLPDWRESTRQTVQRLLEPSAQRTETIQRRATSL
jgi:dTDP-4-dehydrorhamnose reductase